MSLIAASSWWQAAAEYPVEMAVAVIGLTGASVGAGLALRAITRRSKSLHREVLAITITALAIGAIAALLLARAMVLDAGEARTVIGVLCVTALFGTVLVLVASSPLGKDAGRLEAAVRRLEDGHRLAGTGVNRSDELGHVALALDELTRRLDELERERARFDEERRALLSSIGHDLRTPLAALRVAIEALADGVAPDPPRYLRAMNHDVAALSALIDDLFLLSRIESGQLDLARERLDLTEIADEAVEALQPTAAARGIELSLSAPAPVPVDGNATALGRVVRNLLENAIRHAPENSLVQIIVSADGRPSVHVVDEGEGFPAAFAEQAFDRFSRADPSRSRTSGGAGLGLAIARGLVEAHGGEIRIEPPPGGRVTFQLPSLP